MVDRQRLRQVQILLDLKYQRRKEAVVQLAQEEGRLRSSIRQLDEQVQNAEVQGHDSMRAIGADVIWKAWVGRTKTALNLELAQVLSRKELLLRDVKKEFGKVEVAKELMRNQKEVEQKRNALRSLNRAIETSFQR